MNFTEFSKTNKTLILCSIFIAGISAFYLDVVPAVSLIIVLLAIFVLKSRSLSPVFLILCFCIFLFSVFYADYRNVEPDELYRLSPSIIRVKGTVSSQPEITDRKARFEFDVTDIIVDDIWKKTVSKTIVNFYDKKNKFKNINIGDVLELEISTKKPYKTSNPGQFDYGRYLKNSRILTVSYVTKNGLKSIKKPQSGKWLFIQKINVLRNKILTVHSKFLKSPKVEILGGIVFGNSAVPPPNEVKQDFINSGLLHLLAASGMNVALIFGIWFFIVQKLRFPFKFSIITGAVLVFVYALMTGLPPSVMRAAGMLEFILLGKLLDRNADNVALLSFVGTILLLFDPLLINNIGFQLSFIVTLGLMVCIPVLVEKIKPVPAYISGAVLIPVVAQIWVAPVQIFHFNNFATYSILANIIVVPFVGIISFAGFVGSILSLVPFVGEKICLIFDKISEPFITLLLNVSGYFSHLPEALVYLPKPEILMILLFYTLVLFMTFSIKNNFKQKKINFITILLLVVIFFSTCMEGFSSDLKFTFFDVGEGDSILLQTPDDKTILVDTGDKGKYSPAKTAIIPYFKDLGINKLDILLLTHPDQDHIGGTLDILKNVQVGTIYTNGEKSDAKFYGKLLDFISQNHLKTEVITNNQEIILDKNVKITAFVPEDRTKSDRNDTSIILYIVYKDFSGLLMADNEKESYKLLEQYIKDPVDMIKVGHHGSYGAVDNEMLENLKPEYAIISGGENSYGHPAPQVLRLLDDNNVKTYRTDTDNAIKLETDGNKIIYYIFDREKNKWQERKN